MISIDWYDKSNVIWVIYHIRQFHHFFESASVLDNVKYKVDRVQKTDGEDAEILNDLD